VAKSKLPAGRETIREYLLRWKRVGPLLDAIRHEEVRRMSEANRLRAMEQVLSVPVEPKRSQSSGLVDWQRLLSRWQNP
jgi:hypothetical protein